MLLDSRPRAVSALAVLLLLAAFVLRLGVVARAPEAPKGDGTMYDELAWNLASQGIYGVSDAQGEVRPGVVREPGLPVLYAAVYTVAGHRPGAARLIQALLGTATVGLVFLLGRRLLGSPSAGLVAMALLAFSIGPAAHTGRLLSETLAAFLLTAALALTAGRVPRAGELGLAGALMGWLALARFQFAPLVVLLGALYLPDLPRPSRRLLVWAAVGFLAVLSTWWVRNYAVFHRVILARPAYIAQAYDPDAFVATGFLRWLRTWVDDEEQHCRWRFTVVPDPGLLPPQAISGPEERARVERLFQAMGERGSDRYVEDLLTPEADREFADLAARRAREMGPAGWLGLQARRTFHLWRDFPARTGLLGLELPTPGTVRERGALREALRGGLVLLHLAQHAVALLALVGLAFQARRWTWALVWAPVAYATLFHALAGPLESRCLLTTWPLTALLAAAGVVGLLRLRPAGASPEPAA